MNMKWMSSFKRFPTGWTINLRQYDMLGLQVSLYIKLMEEVGSANAAQPASRWLVPVQVCIWKIFELFKGKLNLFSCKRGSMKINSRLNHVFVFYSCWLLIWTRREFLVFEGLLQTGQYKVGSTTCLDSICLLMSSLSRESASQMQHIHRPDVLSLCWFSVMKSSSCSWVKWTLSATKCFSKISRTLCLYYSFYSRLGHTQVKIIIGKQYCEHFSCAFSLNDWSWRPCCTGYSIEEEGQRA